MACVGSCGTFPGSDTGKGSCGRWCAIESPAIVVNFNFFRAVSGEGSKLNWCCVTDYVIWTNGTSGYGDA